MLNVVWMHTQQVLDSLVNFQDVAVKKLLALLTPSPVLVTDHGSWKLQTFCDGSACPALQSSDMHTRWKWVGCKGKDWPDRSHPKKEKKWYFILTIISKFRIVVNKTITPYSYDRMCMTVNLYQGHGLHQTTAKKNTKKTQFNLDSCVLNTFFTLTFRSFLI